MFRPFSVRPVVEEWLESGAFQRLPLGPLEALWGTRARRHVARPLALPPGLFTVGIGGPTLGGSFKTPLALSIADLLASHGQRVALIGHAYQARARAARFVSHDDDVGVVGDEALMCARHARRAGGTFRVVVAPTRRDAVAFLASESFDAWVFDGVLQATPTRFSRSLLVVDAEAPFGNGRHPPAGTLRAPVSSLLACADTAVHVGSSAEAMGAPPERGLYATPRSGGAWVNGVLTGYPALQGRRVGLLTSTARAGRIPRALEERGIRPATHVNVGDHGRFSERDLARHGDQHAIDLWLATSKCVTKLPGDLGGVPVAEIDFSLECSPSLARYLTSPLTGATPSAETP